MRKRFDPLNIKVVETHQSISEEQGTFRKSRMWEWEEIKTLVTGELHGLAVDDEVRQLLSNLSTFLFVLWKVELLTQFHVKHLHIDRG